MAVINKNSTTNRTLTSTGCWEGGVVPGAGDIARWYSGSNAGGNHTGSLTILGIQIDGATANISYSSGTLTLTQTDAVVFDTSNTRKLALIGGVLAFGSGDKTVKLFRSGGAEAIGFDTTGSLTGSGTLTFVSAGLDTTRHRVALGYPYAGFTGVIVLGNYVDMMAYNVSQSVLTSANIVVDGDGCAIRSAVAGITIGASLRTLTVNRDVLFGTPSQVLAIASGVSLAGTGTRTLTVDGDTTMSGTVTGTEGVNVISSNLTPPRLNCSGVTSGLSGPCVIVGARFVVGQSLTANRYAPTSLNIGADGSFEYNLATEDFNFPAAPTGTGAVSISGAFSGNGTTFTEGTLSGFDGSVRAVSGAAVNNNVKLVIYEVPSSGLEWRAAASSGGISCAARITYAGAGNLVTAAPLKINSQDNALTAILTDGTYDLIVPATSGTFQCSGTVQRLNVAGTASARMSLRLGGTNTGDNTLSGDISEVGTNDAILGITKVDAGRWVLSGANSSHTGIHSISAGTLSAQSAKALGSITSSGGIVISDTGTLELAGGVTVDKSQTPLTLRQGFGVSSVGDNTLITSSVFLTGNTTAEVTDGNRLFLDNRAAIVDGSTGPSEVSNVFGITKTGGGELQLGNTLNRFDGVVAVNAGTLTVNNVFSAGTQQNLGTGTTAIPLAGTLKFIGTSGFMNRSLTLTGPTPALECSGSGNYEFQNATQTNEARTLTLKGTSTGVNEVKFALGDTSAATGLAKDGAGTWTVSGALSYSGATNVDAGTLRLARADGNTMTSTVTVDAGATLELVTDTLPGSSGTAGRVLGTGNVTVNGDIRTRGGVVQKGQMRYGGNLTFGSGSKLYIGAAA